MKKAISVLLIAINLLFGLSNWDRCYAAEYILGPNDQLEINIIGQPDLTTKQVVTPDGTISLPVIGRIKVAGLTLSRLDEYLSSEFAKYIEKPKIIVYLTSRPIYIIQHDIKKNTWDVKEAKSIEEARALAGKDYTGEINYGDIINVEISKKPDWWEDNWYKVITGVAILAGIYSTLNK